MALKPGWERQLSRRVKLRELDVFIATVQRGSMAGAAADLGITQPAVSEMMSNLEQALDVRLLDRSSRGVTPTIYGQVLLRGGRAAMDDLRQSIQEMRFLADPTAGDVRVGCPETVAMLLAPIVERLARKHPRVLVHVSDVVAPTLDVPQLRDRTLDLALVRFGGSPQQHPFAEDFNVEVVFNDELVIVVGKKSQWARDPKVNLEQLVNVPWILPPLATSNSRTVFEAFRQRGLPSPKVIMATFSLHLRTGMLRNGTYVTVLPRSLVQLSDDYLSLKVLPIRLPKHDFPLAIVTLKNRMLNPVVQLFIKNVREGLKQIAPAQRTPR